MLEYGDEVAALGGGLTPVLWFQTPPVSFSTSPDEPLEAVWYQPPAMQLPTAVQLIVDRESLPPEVLGVAR
jgi:hypothetical protein